MLKTVACSLYCVSFSRNKHSSRNIIIAVYIVCIIVVYKVQMHNENDLNLGKDVFTCMAIVVCVVCPSPYFFDLIYLFYLFILSRVTETYACCHVKLYLEDAYAIIRFSTQIQANSNPCKPYVCGKCYKLYRL